MIQSSHATSQVSERPTAGQFDELYAQIRAGRVTKESLQQLLRYGLSVAAMFVPGAHFSLNRIQEHWLGTYLEGLVLCKQKLEAHKELVAGLEGLFPKVRERSIQAVVRCRFAPFHCESNPEGEAQKRGYRDLHFVFNPTAIEAVREILLTEERVFQTSDWYLAIGHQPEIDPPFLEMLARLERREELVEIRSEIVEVLDDEEWERELRDKLRRGRYGR
ncbi:MAG: hypothetical protein HYZ63_01755 [Candidatus Andersenbacteria bacterium]|nr:hypothetical protein [Candidatus Andersenbacteria bacterium]